MRSRESSGLDLFQKIHQARAYVFSDSVILHGTHAQSKARTTQIKQKTGGRKIFNKTDQPPQRASTQSTSIAHSTSILVSPPRSAGDDQTTRNVDARRHWPGLHARSGRVGGHRQAAQERRIAQPQRLGTLRLWPRYWIFIGPGAESNWTYDWCQSDKPDGQWDRTAWQIFHKMKELGHPVVPSTTILEQGSLNKENTTWVCDALIVTSFLYRCRSGAHA